MYCQLLGNEVLELKFTVKRAKNRPMATQCKNGAIAIHV